jgi:hypothetical protein
MTFLHIWCHLVLSLKNVIADPEYRSGTTVLVVLLS